MEFSDSASEAETEISPKVDSSRKFLTVRQYKKGDRFEEVELFY